MSNSLDDDFVSHLLQTNDDNESNDCINDINESSNAIIKHKKLQNAIDKACNELMQWNGILLMDVFVENEFKKNHNILSHIDSDFCNRKNPLEPIIRFDSSKYPIQDGYKGVGYTILMKEIERQSTFHGYNIRPNGGGKYRYFRCKHSRVYQNNVHSLEERQSTKYRNVSHSHDRKNNRGKDGLRMSRNSSTQRPLDKEHCCPFYFTMNFDDKSFFVVNGCGFNTHKYHPHIDDQKSIFPSRLIVDAEKKIAQSVLEAHASCGIIRNIINKRTGNSFSRNNLRYLANLNKQLSHVYGLENLSTSDKVIEHLKKKKCDYICLFNQERRFPNDPVLVSDNYLSESTIVESATLILPLHEETDALKYVSDHRISQKLNSTQNLFMAIAWVTPQEKKYFPMFPEVIFIDCVEDTNNEKRPLLTITGRDAHGEMFNVLRAFLPNLRAWSFRWIFNYVLPNIYPIKVLQRIKVAITDGDRQEYENLDIAIKNFISNATRVRCGWHIVDRGWTNNGPKSSLIPNNEHIQYYFRVKFDIQSWIYSWMKPICFTYEQYLISKTLLHQYIRTPLIVNRLGENFVLRVEFWLRNHVVIHSDNFLFCKRKNIRHFDEYSNSKHEGTNRGLKYNAAPVGPSMNLDTSAAILTSNAESKLNYKKRKNTRQILSTKAGNSLNCGSKLIDRGLHLLSNEWIARLNYENKRTLLNEWKVRYVYEYKDSRDVNDSTNNFDFLNHLDVIDRDNDGMINIPEVNGIETVSPYDNDSKPTDCIYPVFKWIYTVSEANQCFQCDCFNHERFGIPCRHIYNVLSSFIGYEQPTHHDLILRYWKDYNYYVSLPIKKTNEKRYIKQMQTMFECSRDMETNGPYIENPLMYKDLPIEEELPPRFILPDPYCLNYNIGYICQNRERLSQFSEIPIGTIVAHSQNHDSDSSNASFEFNQNELLFEDYSIKYNNRCNPNPDIKKSWELMNPFKELLGHLDNEPDISHHNRISDFITKEISLLKESHNERVNVSHPIGTNISCNVPSTKRKKTHGTDYFSKDR